MVVAGVVELMLTVWVDVYVPAAGLNTGAAAGVIVFMPIMYAALATALFEDPLAIAIAWIVCDAETEIDPPYKVEPVVGVVPFVV
jgi:hypothetical protein